MALLSAAMVSVLQAESQKAPGSSLRTPWGHPDLNGVWMYSTVTPLERPARYEGREFLTDEEAKALQRQAQERLKQEPVPPAATQTTQFGIVGNYNRFWYESGTQIVKNRTSLITDPPDGRIPPLTPEAKERLAKLIEARKDRGSADSWIDRDTGERCMTDGMPPMIPYAYNNNFQIIQGRTHLVLLHEMFSNRRVIALDATEQPGPDIRQWFGHSRGRWEGSALVVETTNYVDKTDQVWNNSTDDGIGLGVGIWRAPREHLRVVERFTRVDANTLDYQATLTDPTTWTRSWTFVNSFVRVPGPVYEYACHEGNYGMRNLLAGARAAERQGKRLLPPRIY
jgi:hypothetical protein